jgi:hypothetical protein
VPLWLVACLERANVRRVEGHQLALRALDDPGGRMQSSRRPIDPDQAHEVGGVDGIDRGMQRGQRSIEPGLAGRLDRANFDHARVRFSSDASKSVKPDSARISFISSHFRHL